MGPYLLKVPKPPDSTKSLIHELLGTFTIQNMQNTCVQRNMQRCLPQQCFEKGRTQGAGPSASCISQTTCDYQLLGKIQATLLRRRDFESHFSQIWFSDYLYQKHSWRQMPGRSNKLKNFKSIGVGSRISTSCRCISLFLCTLKVQNNCSRTLAFPNHTVPIWKTWWPPLWKLKGETALFLELSWEWR